LGKKTLSQRGWPVVKVLCVDEIAQHKGHGSYRLVISAPEMGIVLDVLKERTQEALCAWLEQRGVDWCAQVEVICADMWDAYHEAAIAKLPNAKRVVDRFHVMKNLNDALSKARRTIQHQADEATKALLKGCRWWLVKNRENLDADDRADLEQALAASPELSACYQLKEDFRSWFNLSSDRHNAEQTLLDWIASVEASGFRALQAFVRTLQNWKEAILNYFDGRHTNGFAEGVNLKIRLIHRRAFGYRNFEQFRLHILVAFDPVSR
jgi:transposase